MGILATVCRCSLGHLCSGIVSSGTSFSFELFLYKVKTRNPSCLHLSFGPRRKRSFFILYSLVADLGRGTLVLCVEIHLVHHVMNINNFQRERI